MSERARAARGERDENHGAIAGRYLSLGCSVIDTSTVGRGYPDLTIGLVGVTELVEVKTENGDLSTSQLRFVAEWRGSKIRVVRDVGDVDVHVMEIRRRVAGRALS